MSLTCPIKGTKRMTTIRSKVQENCNLILTETRRLYKGISNGAHDDHLPVSKSKEKPAPPSPGIILRIHTCVCGVISSTRSSDIKILGGGPFTPVPPSKSESFGGENHKALNFFAGNLNSSCWV